MCVCHHSFRAKNNYNGCRRVVLKRRADLIPNLVETVKGYAKHEKETLDAVIKARNTYVNASLPEEQMEASGELTQALNKLMMLSEAYPDLKANTNFVSLQKDLKETEDKITRHFSRVMSPHQIGMKEVLGAHTSKSHRIFGHPHHNHIKGRECGIRRHHHFRIAFATPYGLPPPALYLAAGGMPFIRFAL